MNRRTLFGALAALVACAALGLVPAAAHADAAPAARADSAAVVPRRSVVFFLSS